MTKEKRSVSDLLEISTHTSREGSDRPICAAVRLYLNFNPHFPWGKWPRPLICSLNALQFQPTLPVREVTQFSYMAKWHMIISTHTSREGSDNGGSRSKESEVNFNPHFPWGKWPTGHQSRCHIYWFQPTLPVREVTHIRHISIFKQQISTHTSREGSDILISERRIPYFLFQPTLPVREVTNLFFNKKSIINISTHTSREGSDATESILTQSISISTHTSREGSDAYGYCQCLHK